MNDNQNPTADQPLVTHADLDAITSIERDYLGDDGPEDVMDLVHRLRAAAEADKPALPEGWVLSDIPGGSQRVLWHADGRLYLRTDCIGLVAHVDDYQEPPIPLTTAASLAPEGWHVDEDGEGRSTVWDANFDVVHPRRHQALTDPVFDVLAALVSAAQAERGETK